ncbi:MAG: hypothetical protein EOP00_16935 [Pedobacter sp.]|nr:MAG: hypothetical protein EOP00_16935 [Pedobacter sp.]
MYNFAVSKETYVAVITWLESLHEYDDSYERMRVVEIKTRRIQQKAAAPVKAYDNTQVAYLEIEPKKETENLNLELLLNYIQDSNESFFKSVTNF